MARKSKSWAVVLLGPGIPEQRTEHTSSEKAYTLVNDTWRDVLAGASPVARIRVERWYPDGNRWITYDLIDPKEN